ncbi:PP2C family protein-serine/threonine phosphatase [Gorillibacterium timonense]|uniref:PP2C family protein-serine/threonine phosphatase n=1 Tax=Gorillibacterium timonense TaxID=1689269 RepID=UPI00071D7CA2|nr:PAS domain S-box protein [Gorillibacterium timonense]
MKVDMNCKNLKVSPSPSQCMDHFGCIYENNHLVTLLIDPKNGGIVDANRAACTFYGYTVQELRKRSITDLNGKQASEPDSFLHHALPNGDYWGNQVFTEKHQLSDKTTIDVEIHTGMITMLGRSCIYSVVHNITERVRAEKRLRESEERYRDLVELCPEAILVHNEGIIRFANKKTENLFGKARIELIGQNMLHFFNEDSVSGLEAIKLRLNEPASESFRFEHRFVRYDGRIFDLEIAGAPIIYEERIAMQLVLRDITRSKREIEQAVRLQEHRHTVPFPLDGKAAFEKLYIPATTLSGDFFLFHKINEEQVIGIIGDVTGKGISAALNISALRVLVANSLLITQDPVRLLHDLNQKAIQHLGEDYIAACCFLFDFGEGRLLAAGAGINEFVYAQGDNAQRITVKGAPLGMFANSQFEEVNLSFQREDKFCFYSDGMDLLFDLEELCGSVESLEKKIAQAHLQDDCTWLSFQIK